MDIQKIKELALANGFKLKEQASGNMDLNAYVYDFANAIEQATKAQAVPEGFVLVRKEPSEQLLSKAIRKYLQVSDLSIITSRMAHLYELMIQEAMIEAQEQK